MRQLGFIIFGILLVVIGINAMYPLPHRVMGTMWGVILILVGVVLISGLVTEKKISPVAVGLGVVLLLMGIHIFYPLPYFLMSKLWALFFIVVGLGFLITRK